MILRLIFAFCCTFFVAHGSADEGWQEETQLLEKRPYVRPASCPGDVWAAVEPYFLPESHPLRQKLDTIFSQSRVLESAKSMKRAGFVDPHPRKLTSAIVTRHPRLPGVIIKAYLDTSEERDWYKWLQRIEGARLVQADVDEHGFNSLIKVPKKWIYPLPLEPQSRAGAGYHPKYFILVAQDMGVLSDKGNEYAWKNMINRELLAALYLIISLNRMTDSIRIHNIPFCHDGKIAFIDTEWFNIPESYATVRFWKLYDYLSAEMADYLKGLVENGVPQ